jgi:hypothetical protein
MIPDALQAQLVARELEMLAPIFPQSQRGMS